MGCSFLKSYHQTDWSSGGESAKEFSPLMMKSYFISAVGGDIELLMFLFYWYSTPKPTLTPAFCKLLTLYDLGPLSYLVGKKNYHAPIKLSLSLDMLLEYVLIN